MSSLSALSLSREINGQLQLNIFSAQVSIYGQCPQWNGRFAEQAHEVRQDLSKKVASEVVESDEMLTKLNVGAIPVITHFVGKDAPLSQHKNLDTRYMDKAKKSLGESSEGNYLFQRYRALYNQMMMPMGLRKMLPVGLFGVFCLMAIMLMITTDDSRIFNASAAIVQDMIILGENENTWDANCYKYDIRLS